MVRIHFLGTANAFGTAGRNTSCYLLEGSKTILVDAGYSTLSNLQSIGKSILNLDAITVSHLHPDHMMGLPQMVLENKYVIKRQEKIPLYGPLGINAKLEEFLGVMYDKGVGDHLSEIFDIYEYGENESFDIPGGSIQTLPAVHSGNARMQIINLDGKSIGYTGDSAYHRPSLEKLMECDLMITEVGSVSHFIPDHTTLEELYQLPAKPYHRIYLSHIGRSILDVAETIVPPFYLAEDGLVIDI